jgi:hypothetical protein
MKTDRKKIPERIVRGGIAAEDLTDKASSIGRFSHDRRGKDLQGWSIRGMVKTLEDARQGGVG